MSEVDVTHISLVKRGANRQPIKIHKSEDGNQTMKTGTQGALDLANIGAKAIKSEKGGAPVLVAAIVKKGEGERISELLKDVEGLQVVSVTANDDNDCDMINFVDAPQMDENCIVYKHDDNMALVIADVKTSTCKMDFWANSTSFKENIQKTSFFPNLREASYTLVDTIANIVYEGDDADVAKKAEGEVAAFGEFVTALVTALPVKVMKSLEALDFNAPEAAPEAAAKKDDATADDNTDANTDKGAGAEAAAKTEESEVAAKSDDAPKGEAAKEEGTEAPKSDAAKQEEVPAWAQSLVQKMDDIHGRLDTVESGVKEAGKKAEEAANSASESKSLAEKAESVLDTARGTVVADAQDESLTADDEHIPDQANNDDLAEAGIELY